MTKKLLILGVAVLLSVFGIATVNATHSDSLFVYDFRNATSTVANQAAANSGVDMVLSGNWSSNSEGVNFTGDLVSLQSGGAADPPSNPTISVPGSNALGMSVVFSSNGACINDSQNISQIGSFGAGASQLKLQLSKCTDGYVYPECRVAGGNTPTGTGPERGTTAIVADTLYRLECIKGPDVSNVGAELTMRLTEVASDHTYTDTFTIPETGTISTNKDVTAGNKSPLPAQGSNTDQFTGMVQALGYCSSTSAANAQTCVENEVVATLPSTGEEYSVYTYDLRDTTGTVSNTAALNAGVDLVLSGDWNSDSTGTTFTGDTEYSQSGGTAVPTSGPTLDFTEDQAVGTAAVFSRLDGCLNAMQLLTQTGNYANYQSQIKLQLSKCNSSSNNEVFPECRFAGENTLGSELALRGTTAIIADTPYRLECVKGPNAFSSNSVTMRLTNLTTNQVSTDTFSISNTGDMSTTAAMGVGNRSPLPSQANNDVQLNGTIQKLGYCASDEVATTELCLETTVSYVAPPAPTDVVDEIKYSYGDTRDEVVFSWRGSEDTLYYGATNTYGQTATASASAITPVDTTGPFMEVRVSGLSLGTTYHYKIGTAGLDHTFTTAAGDTDDFQALAVGDTIASTCREYEQDLFDQMGALSPNFVLHHGDISIANECGVSAVHQFFMDAEASFATNAAFMVTWGNHEYGNPTSHAPEGTPRDSLANYKGRLAVPNPQTVPNDTATKTTHPGCGEEIESTVNTCQGEDWGWFRSGRVLFISFPEPWWNAITDWETKADALMTDAQEDSTIDFVVTYGHRPVISSTDYTPPNNWESVFGALAAEHSPSTSNPDGKYVLDLAGHRHGMEVFEDWNNLTQVVNGGGGQGLINFQTVLPESTYRAKHLGFSTLSYDASAHELTYQMICGPAHSGEDITCTPGAVLYSKTFSAQ